MFFVGVFFSPTNAWGKCEILMWLDLFCSYQVVEVMHMNQFPLYSCYLVLIAVVLVFMLLYYLSLKFIKQKSSQDW